MFGVSFPELMVVFLVALLIFGPDKLPELARTLGKISGQFRRQSDSLRREFYNTVYKPADDFRSSIDRETRSLMSEPVAPKKDEEKRTTSAEANPPNGEAAPKKDEGAPQ